MKRVLWAAFAVTLGSTSCAEELATVGETGSSISVGELGSLTMALTGYDARGRQYWLRNAEFVIRPSASLGYDGGESAATTISTETDPLAETVSLSLTPGLYDVTLQGQYYLEYQTTRGVRRADGVTLLSASTQQAVITPNQATQLLFRFAVDESGRGELTIGIDVETHTDAGVDGGVPDTDGGLGGGFDGGLDGGTRLDGGNLDGGRADAALGDGAVSDAATLGDGAVSDAATADAGGTDDDGGETSGDAGGEGDDDLDAVPAVTQ